MPEPLTILHVIGHFAGGGVERSIVATSKYARRANLNQRHVVLPLGGSVSPAARARAHREGVLVTHNFDAAKSHQILSDADVVVLHHWNCPQVYEFLRSDLPPMRAIVWTHTYGHTAPQIILPELGDWADRVLLNSVGSLDIFAAPRFAGRVEVLYATADVERVAGLTPCAHDDFNVGYIGTVNFVKMHPRFVAMSVEAARRIPRARFIVCGGDGEAELRAQVAALGFADRFDFRGQVEDIRSVLETLDVFGYPLCEETYAASDIAVREAMWAGLPVVVFPFAGLKHLVAHERTGLVVNDEAEYVAALERLWRQPELRARLGANAREYALAEFDTATLVARLADTFESVMRAPKRARAWPNWGDRPAEWFVAALGPAADAFAISLRDDAAHDIVAVERRIGTSPVVLVNGEGGIFQHRNRYPDDPHLRLWSGLALGARGRTDSARREFEAAVALGLQRRRIEPHVEALVAR